MKLSTFVTCRLGVSVSTAFPEDTNAPCDQRRGNSAVVVVTVTSSHILLAEWFWAQFGKRR